MRTECKYFLNIVFLTVTFLHVITGVGNGSSISPNSLRLNEIQVLENGYLKVTDGDPYIVFPEVEQPYCSAIGVELGVSFGSYPEKPVLLELFWSTELLGFGEENKVFFTLQPRESSKDYHFVIPLYRSTGLTQIRLDFPNDLETSFRIEDYHITLLNDVTEEMNIIDVFRSLSDELPQMPDILLIPYMLKALMHGPQRLLHDKGFLIFWLLLISSLLFFIRRLAVNKKE